MKVRPERADNGWLDCLVGCAVAAPIQEFAFRQPIVMDTEGVIVCEHSRYKAAQCLGLKKVPVHVAKELTPE